jgi:hypothetical protein
MAQRSDSVSGVRRQRSPWRALVDALWVITNHECLGPGPFRSKPEWPSSKPVDSCRLHPREDMGDRAD